MNCYRNYFKSQKENENEYYIPRNLITHADGSCLSIAIIRVCVSVCLSVCLSVCTIKPKRLKLKSPNLLLYVVYTIIKF